MRYFRLLGLCSIALVIVLSAASYVGLEALFDTKSFFILVGFTTLLSLYCVVVKRPIAQQWVRIGLPLGVISSLLIQVGGLQNVAAATTLRISVADSFLPIIYGGLVTTFGLIFAKPSASHNEYAVGTRDFLFLLLFCSLLVWGMDRSAGVLAYLDTSIMTLVAGPSAAYLFLAYPDYSLQRIQTFIVAGTLCCVFLSIMSYGYVVIEEAPEKVGPSMALGILGVFWGSVLLVLVQVFSNDSIEAQQISTRSSWHLVEAYALLTLMLFTPPSIFESGALG